MARRVLALLLLHLLFISVAHCKQQVTQKVIQMLTQKVIQMLTQVMQKVIQMLIHDMGAKGKYIISKIFKPKKEEIR